jgi:hypothetical protein
MSTKTACRKDKIIKFCIGGKTTRALAAHLDCNKNERRWAVATLIRAGKIRQLLVTPAGSRMRSFYVYLTVGSDLAPTYTEAGTTPLCDHVVEAPPPTTFMYPATTNLAFVQTAHNIFSAASSRYVNQ